MRDEPLLNREFLALAVFGLAFVFGVPAGIYAAVVAATCLELKDRLYGNKFDLTEWLLTVVGGTIAALIWLII